MGAEAETAQVSEHDPIDGVGESVGESDPSVDTGASGQEHQQPDEPGQDTDGADAVPPAPESSESKNEPDYAAEALSVLNSIGARMGVGEQQPDQAKPNQPSQPAQKNQNAQTPADDDDFSDILKAAREDFGDELPDKVLKPLAAKIRESVTKAIGEQIHKQYEPALKYIQQQQQAEADKIVKGALDTLYSTGDAAIKQAIGPNFEKASQSQQNVVREILTKAGALRQASHSLGKPITANDAVKQVTALMSMEMRKTDSYKQAQARGRARTVASPTSRSNLDNPTIDHGDKDRAEIEGLISNTLGRRR